MRSTMRSTMRSKMRPKMQSLLILDHSRFGYFFFLFFCNEGGPLHLILRAGMAAQLSSAQAQVTRGWTLSASDLVKDPMAPV